MGWTLYEQQRYMRMLLRMPDMDPDSDWNYSNVDWWMLMVQTWRERLDNCNTLKDLYYTFCFLRDMGYKVDRADFTQAYKNRFEELRDEMSIQKANGA